MATESALNTLLSELKDRAQESTLRLRFCDAYAAMKRYMKVSNIMHRVQEYDAFSESPASTPTLSLLCVLHSLSTNLPEQYDPMVRRWAFNMTTIVQYDYEERSYQSLLDTFLRMFSSRPKAEDFKEALPYRVGAVIPHLLEHQESYYEVQRILSEYYFELGFGFHDGYINVLTLGLFGFLWVTRSHPKQRQMIVDYMMFQTQLELENEYYYDEPEKMRREFTFSF